MLGTSTGPLGAANAVTDFSVFSKKPLPTQIYRCLPAPHRCGAQVQCQVNGLTYADFSSVQTLLKDRKYVSMVHSPFLKILWASAQRIKAATTTCGCTRFSSIIMATTNREKSMSNGFSSRKDLLRTKPTRKVARQSKTKATVRFRHNRPYVQHGSHEHN